MLYATLFVFVLHKKEKEIRIHNYKACFFMDFIIAYFFKFNFTLPS